MVVKPLKSLINLISRGITVILHRGPDRAFLLVVRYVSWKFRFQSRVSNLPPKLNYVITVFTITLLRGMTRLFHLVAPDRYTDADPYEVLYVDPNEITYISGLHDQKRRGWVVNGDWDENLDRFMDQPIPTAIRQHYEEGKKWDETVLTEEYDEQARFNRKCEKIEQLHDRIARNGFRSQRELHAEDPKETVERANATMSPMTNEITVDVGRNGEFLWNMLGKHRLSIAKVLDIDVVPVLVFSRHRKWQNILDKSRRDANNLLKLQNHPDLEH